MSKVKKKPTRLPGGLSREEIVFEKVIHFSGWFFLIVLLILLSGFFIFDMILDLVELELNTITFALVIFTGTNSAISFAVATRVKKNRDQKKKLFIDWLLGEFIFCIIAIFVVAAYQW
ncbi:MAG: hypothetical protein KGD61_01545 [Candidatus Lokiarchaeota archaeon]|nr:hypothetical protein [Candidatus Lokiarchaeota archaeon]